MRLTTIWEATQAGIKAARETIDRAHKLDLLQKQREARDGDLLALLSDLECWHRWQDLHGGRPVPLEKLRDSRHLLHRLWTWGIKRPADHPGLGASPRFRAQQLAEQEAAAKQAAAAPLDAPQGIDHTARLIEELQKAVENPAPSLPVSLEAPPCPRPMPAPPPPKRRRGRPRKS